MKVCGKEYESLLAFYKSKEWKKLRAAVLKLDHYECQQCKKEGRYSKAQTVHHVHHVKDRPELALTYMHEGKRNLVSLCRECHNKAHPEKFRKWERKEPLTPERW